MDSMTSPDSPDCGGRFSRCSANRMGSSGALSRRRLMAESIRIGAGGTGSLRAPCADPPITADGDRFEAPPRQESLCLGVVWVIEGP